MKGLLPKSIPLSFAVLMLTAVAAFSDDQRQLRIVPSGPPGVCTVEQWKRDWPGCRYEDGVAERHLSIVEANGVTAFRVDYAMGAIGPEEGGVGWRFPISSHDGAELAYTLEFSEDFDWVKGGKLPGLCGGPESVTGGNPANGQNGFSARLMWRADGRGEAYVYHMNQPGKYGESFPFPPDFRFPTVTEVGVRIRVVMNTPGKRDGSLDVWIESSDAVEARHVVSRSDMEWRSIPSIQVDSLLFETFHGGGDSSWAPRRPCFTLFQDLEWSFLNVPGKEQ